MLTSKRSFLVYTLIIFGLGFTAGQFAELVSVAEALLDQLQFFRINFNAIEILLETAGCFFDLDFCALQQANAVAQIGMVILQLIT